MPPPSTVHLASSPYSGSTLVSHLLGIHPAIATVSDVSGRRRERRMDQFACSCGRLMSACPFWSEIRERMHASGDVTFDLANFELGFDVGRSSVVRRWRAGSLRWNWLEELRDEALRRWPRHEAAMRRVGARNRLFAATVRQVTGGAVFVDASKERLRSRYLRRYVDEDLRVIHLVRDVRGVVASARGHTSHARSSIDALARDWVRTNETLARVGRQAGADRYLVITYEALCRAPKRTLDRMYDFCAVAPLASEVAEPELHLLGNRVRLGSLAEIRLDERWRHTLSAEEQNRILTIAGAAQERLTAAAAD